jgi:hypothetical protein
VEFRQPLKLTGPLEIGLSAANAGSSPILDETLSGLGYHGGATVS